MNLTETRKEDDVYYQGAFWIVAPSFKDVLKGNFELIGVTLESDYYGNYTNYGGTKKALTHQRLWRDKFGQQYPDKSYTFFPRGRVAIYDGVAFIHLNSRCNTPKIIDAIVKMYNIGRLDLDLDLNDTYQGGHYDFELK